MLVFQVFLNHSLLGIRVWSHFQFTAWSIPHQGDCVAGQHIHVPRAEVGGAALHGAALPSAAPKRRLRIEERDRERRYFLGGAAVNFTAPHSHSLFENF